MLGSYKVKLSTGPISLDKLLLVWQKYCDLFSIISLLERESEFRTVGNFILLDSGILGFGIRDPTNN